TNMCARHSTSLVTSTSRSCSGFLTICRSSRCPILGSISRHALCCRQPTRSLPTRPRSTCWSTNFRRRDARSFSPAAGLCVPAALEVLRARGKTSASIRSAELARRIRDEPADAAQFPLEPGLLDPRRAIDELDRVIPKNYDSVSGSGHQSYFHSTMRGRRPENYHAIREFGAIGNGISFAIGVAAARNNGKAV